jgi:hypothetical protein
LKFTGEGKLGSEGRRLMALGDKILNIEPDMPIPLPVITTPLGGLREQSFTKSMGWLLVLSRADALAAQICRLATEPGIIADYLR